MQIRKVTISDYQLEKPTGCRSKPMVPFWGRCTTHFSLFEWLDWDVHWGLTDLALEKPMACQGAVVHGFGHLLPVCPGHVAHRGAAEAVQMDPKQP